MKYNLARTMLRFVSFVALLVALVVSVRVPAQDQQGQEKEHVRYTVTDLGTLGGTSSAAQGLNNKGWVAGDANLQGDQTEHAFFWQNGVMTDLGTLGGLNSFAGPVNERGLVAGVAQTSSVDPLGENWASGFSCNPNGPCEGYQNLVLAFVWQNGVMTALPTLGGNNAESGFYGGVNNLGQVVGWAENNTQDPNCMSPQVFDWQAVIWGPNAGEIQELPLLPGDSISGALAINDNGQAVGGSGPICGFPSTAVSFHAVLWQNGSVTDLGSLGGVMNNVGWAINNRGQVVGFSDLTGDTITHAFLWQNGVMTDLGALSVGSSSFAYGINDNSQVVGQSCDQRGNCRGFLWQDGVMTDLNTLTPPGSSLYVIQADSINSEGEIVGIAFDQSTLDTPAILAVPAAGGQGSHPSPKVTLPESVRKLLQQRRGFGRFGAGPIRPQ